MVRTRNRLPQAGTSNGESRPDHRSGSPTSSGEGNISQQRTVTSRHTYYLRSQPGKSHGASGAGTGCHSLRTIGGVDLNRRDSTEQSATAGSFHRSTSPTTTSSDNSIFQSPISSPKSFETTRSSTSSPLSVDVVQEACAVQTAPTIGIMRKRKKWTNEMNIFIMRSYFIITKIGTNTRGYLDTLHKTFLEKYPEMNASKQRVGDQRRSIINNKLLPQDTLNRIKSEVSAYLQQNPEALSCIPTPTTGRIRWSDDMNEAILRSYYEVTELESDMTLHRKKTQQKFAELYPHLAHLSEQRISDQRRVIINNKLISEDRIQQIRQEVNSYLASIHTRTLLQENLSNNNIHTTITNNDTEEIDNEINYTQNSNARNNNQTNSYSTLGNVNNNIDHTKVAETFKIAMNKFKDSDPTLRPNIPKQKCSKKFSIIVNYLDTVILPQYLTIEPDFTTLHALIYSAAYTAAICNGAKIEIDNTAKKKQQKPRWQIRLENKIKNIRCEIGRLIQYLAGNRSTKHIETINAIKIKYQIHAQHEDLNIELEHFLDTLKQKLSAAASRLRRYVTCTARKSQNFNFTHNERSFYRNFINNNQTNTHSEPPPSESLREFWSQIWENPVDYNHNADWIQNSNNLNQDIPEMEFENIPINIFIQVLKRAHNWKSPGTDKIHNYWYKKFTCIHPHLFYHLNTFIQSPENIPEYIMHGITYLLPKDNNDTKNPAKYRPITCLQTVYKLLTSCINDLLQTHIAEHSLLAEQQKGCRKNSYGCKEQLTIDAITINDAFRNKRNIHTMFIDYRKAFDSVPHSWLVTVLYQHKIHPKIIAFLQTSMQRWQTILQIRNSTTSTPVSSEPIRIQRGIFQGDALSPLWFCLALNPLSNLLNQSQYGYKLTRNNIPFTLSHLMYMDDIKLYASNKNELFELADITQQFSTDIQMDFGIDKCKILSIHKGKIQNDSYILDSGQTIEPLDEHSTYRYLGFNQSRKIHHRDSKLELTKKYKHRLNQILNSHLNSKNTTKAINTYAIPILTYSFGILNWSQTELKKLQTIINTHMRKHRKHHPKSCIERLTLPRHEGGRGLVDIQNLHNGQISRLRNYFHTKSELSSLHKIIVDTDHKLTPLNLHEKTTQQNQKNTDSQQKMARWAEKALHGRHRSDLNQAHVDKDKSNEWIRRGELFPETEGFMFAIQDQVIATRNYNKYIIKDPNQQNDLCRLCNSASETIQHITGACKSLVQTDYKHRHDQVAAIVHQHISHKYKFIEKKIPYYKYKPDIVLENRNYKIYWDRTIITDKTIHYNRPDITFHDKQNKTVYLIDVAIPNTHNIKSTISEKLTKYQDLAIEIKTQWKADTVHIVPIVLSSTGVIPKTLSHSLQMLHIPDYTRLTLQKATILNTCRITRKFLSSSIISSSFTI